MSEILLVCKHHGELPREKVNLSGKSRTGEQRYKCKACMKALHAKHFVKNKDKVLTKQRIYRALYPEKRRLSRRNWLDKILVTDPAYFIRLRKMKRDPEKERIRKSKSKKKQAEIIGDSYVKQAIRKGNKHIKAADIPQSMVELKRVLIQLQREMDKRRQDGKD